MATTMYTDPVTAACAEALFTSDRTTGARLLPDEIATLILSAVARYGSVRGCAAEVAAAYGEHPETAVPRMRWALSVVDPCGHPEGPR
jgi:hypothetical protein